MYSAPAVVLTASIEERLAITYAEYVAEPLRAGVSVEELHQRLQCSLDNIRRKLGGLLHKQLCLALKNAFDDATNVFAHEAWIVPLLLDYYDPQYHHAFHGTARTVIFQGTRAQTLAFLHHHFAKAI